MTASPLGGVVAVVTGASKGLGAAVARELAGAGAAVGLIARSSAELQRLAGELRSSGGRVAWASCDMTEPSQAAAATAQLTEQLGDITVLVNNAASILPVGPAPSLDVATWAKTLQLNVAGAMATTVAVLPAMLRHGRGTVVNVSSGAASLPGMPGGSAYTVSKAALETLSQHLDAELAPQGISVRAVRPGRVDTPMQAQLRDEQLVGTALAARHQAWLETGELLHPSRPARLVTAICINPSGFERVVSFYDAGIRERF